MTDIRKETVIIVHGTWAAPKADATNWYLPSQASSSSNFVSKLNFELENRARRPVVGLTAKTTNSFFHWSGKNDWIDRSLGATQLAATINRLQSEGWRVHIIAHSHGGNVALEALPSVKPTAASPFGIVAYVGYYWLCSRCFSRVRLNSTDKAGVMSRSDATQTRPKTHGKSGYRGDADQICSPRVLLLTITHRRNLSWDTA